MASKQAGHFREALEDNPIVPGEKAYLISIHWFKTWARYSGYEKSEGHPQPPGPISNNGLVINGVPKKTIMKDYDYLVLARKPWELLHGWYQGGPEIPVSVVEDQTTHEPAIVVHDWVLKAFYNDTVKPIITNKFELIAAIKQKACEIFSLPPDEVRIIDYWNQNYVKVLPDDKTISDLQLIDTQEILVEKKTKSGEFPQRQRANKLVARTNSSISVGFANFSQHCPREIGLSGLKNLGNTCFFNSALQVLLHTDFLTNFFFASNWRSMVNTKNSKGTGGLIINSYAQLVDDIWVKSTPIIAPETIRKTLAQFAPQFGDFKQHDSQELLLFILDYIHEDLNQAARNDYIEGIEGNGSNDVEIAEAAWKRHKMANDSVIVDLFHGQLRSSLICKECGSSKVVFDPYISATIPLPIEKLISIRYCFIPLQKTSKRAFAKIFAKRGCEVRGIEEDACNRFSAKKAVCIARDDLTANFSVLLPSSMRKVEYYAFEVKDSVLYALSTVSLQKTEVSRQTVLDSPLLIEAKESIQLTSTEAAEMAEYLFQPSKYPETDYQKSLKAIADKGKDCDQPRISVNVSSKGINEVEVSDFPPFITQSFRVLINPKYTCEDYGFNWGAVSPFDRENDSTEPANSPKMTLTNCLELFSAEEELDEVNAWFCSKCKKCVTARAKIEFWSLPDVLILHLRRFVFKDQVLRKVSSFVDFPFDLNMAKHVKGPQQKENLEYKLYAIIHHIGSMEGGHYYATIFSTKLNSWFSFNDDAVYPVNEKDVIADTAYVLLYHRCKKPEG